MKCSKCQFDNPGNLKYCGECGAKLEILCPGCHAPNPPLFKFCGECGRSLSQPAEPLHRKQPELELSFEEKLDKIQRYLPGGLTDKILTQRGKIEGERRQVTVMFCDMKGFTPLSEKLGPEEVYALMDQLYEILIHKVHDYEGTVNEMTGDGIMALFGAPIALEDGPQRAIRSALAIHREISLFSDRVRQEKDQPPIKMRIGINTGPVIVGTLGNNLRVEFKAVGETVNLASRMEGLAEPGTTLVTEETFKLTEGFFRFEALGEKQIKGKEEPVKVYQVIAPSTRKTRFDVSAERGLTPFVGRQRELELLLDGLERSAEGQGQAFSIMAEAGVGKSRFLYEFRKVVSNKLVTFLEGKCLSYGRGVAYHPIIDILKAHFDIADGEEDYKIKEKVQGGLKALEADESSTLPYILELLSVKDSGFDRMPMSPEARKDRTMEALKRIVLKGSEIQPLILVIEDLHWVDKSSEDALKNLLESLSGARVMLIFTYRPEFVQTWGGRSYHNQITLSRLSNRESLSMVSYLLGAWEIDRDLEKLILEKTEGIPFFIEEFVKSLTDLKIVAKDDHRYRLVKDLQAVTVPSTIQDMIMARIDTLPEATKAILQTGSVIEREFSHELIRRVTGLPEEQLLAHLSALKDSELIYERGIYPRSAYIFKHALTREVVDNSILTTRKRKLHEEIGKAIEELYRENIEDYYGILSEHFIAGDNYAKGAEYSKVAGRKAEKAASFPEAIAYGKKRVNCLEKLPTTSDVQKQIIDARVTLGLYLSQMNYHVEAKEAVDSVFDLAISHNYKKRLAQIYTIIGAYNFLVVDNYPGAFKAFEEALRISEEIKDNTNLALAHYFFGSSLAWNCEFERATYHIQSAIDINFTAKNLWGVSPEKGSLGYFCYYFQGQMDLAFQTTSEAYMLAEESGDIYSKAVSYMCYGVSCYGKGLWEEAEKYFLKAIELCERINFHSWNGGANFFLGEIYFKKENLPKSMSYYEKSYTLSEYNHILPSFVSLGKVAHARARVINKEKYRDLEDLYGHSRDNKVKQYEGWIARYIGEILLSIDEQHISEAEHWIDKAIEADQRCGIRLNLGHDYALLADMFKRKGDRLKAQENLGKAIELYKECGADGWQQKAENQFADLL